MCVLILHLLEKFSLTEKILGKVGIFLKKRHATFVVVSCLMFVVTLPTFIILNFTYKIASLS